MISASRTMPFSPAQIWSVIASPQGHVDMDGSETVKGVASGPAELEQGSTFRMKMRLGVPYLMRSTVVEYEKERLIAWAHRGKHRWRFELQPLNGGTQVTESFDWSTSISPKFIERMGYPVRHEANLVSTLERLEAVVASRAG
ncbi:MAG: SRPBCC family protein [Acidimicrobiales bacterium]|nr:SRPBCC family protein [Acidimicrobiales bacterium]